MWKVFVQIIISLAVSSLFPPHVWSFCFPQSFHPHWYKVHTKFQEMEQLQCMFGTWNGGALFDLRSFDSISTAEFSFDYILESMFCCHTVNCVKTWVNQKFYSKLPKMCQLNLWNRSEFRCFLLMFALAIDCARYFSQKTPHSIDI